MYCEKCGAFIEDGAKFCMNCGAASGQGAFTQPQSRANETDARPAENRYDSGRYDYSENRQVNDEPYRITEIRQPSANAGGGYSSAPFTAESYINPSFGEAIRSFFIRYIDFSGRSSRAEYWYVYLLNIIISFACGFLAKQVSGYFGIINAVYTFATFIPALAIDFRRLHDTGRSGWYTLLWFLPIVGWIILLIYHCQPGTGPNIYGPEPKRK